MRNQIEEGSKFGTELPNKVIPAVAVDTFNYVVVQIPPKHYSQLHQVSERNPPSLNDLSFASSAKAQKNVQPIGETRRGLVYPVSGGSGIPPLNEIINKESLYLHHAEIVKRCLRNEPNAWLEFYNQFVRLIYSIVRKSEASPDIRDYIVQEVFNIAYKDLHKLRKHVAVSAWLITITYREIPRMMKKYPIRAEISDKLDPYHGLDDLELAENRVDMEHLLTPVIGSLPEQQRVIIEELFFKPITPSYEELAAKVGLSEHSIGPYRGRALKNLKKLLEKDTRENLIFKLFNKDVRKEISELAQEAGKDEQLLKEIAFALGISPPRDLNKKSGSKKEKPRRSWVDIIYSRKDRVVSSGVFGRNNPFWDVIFLLPDLPTRIAYRRLYFGLSEGEIAEETDMDREEVKEIFDRVRIMLWEILPMKKYDEKSDTGQLLRHFISFYPPLNPDLLIKRYERKRRLLKGEMRNTFEKFFGNFYKSGQFDLKSTAEATGLSVIQVENVLIDAIKKIERM